MHEDTAETESLVLAEEASKLLNDGVKEFICSYRSLRVVVIVLVFSELADNKNVWVLVMYFPKLEIISNIFSVLDHGLCFNPSILQFTSMDPKQNFFFRWECL